MNRRLVNDSSCSSGWGRLCLFFMRDMDVVVKVSSGRLRALCTCVIVGGVGSGEVLKM